MLANLEIHSLTSARFLNSILTSSSYPAKGAIVDARGLPGSTGTSMSCTTNPLSGVTKPSTILLPATGSTPIVISTTWVLPSNTRLIGQGDGVPVTSNFTPGTWIQASGVMSTATMIQFGSSSICPSSVCTGISVENLTLDGQAIFLNGITNDYAQDSTYLDHVTFYQLLGTGLTLSTAGSGTANNSGPYTNITFDTGGYSGTSGTVCLNINGLTSLLGIYGLRCKSETHDAPAAVLLDSSNTSMQDVTTVGFYDGILVGSNAVAHSNILINIVGDTSLGVVSTTPINAVHISNSHNAVTDLSIVGVSNSGLAGTYTIEDDVTSVTLPDEYVGLYALGESGSGGYGRFTTSPNAPTWAVGSSVPSGNCTTATRGSLYSCVGTSTNCSSTALWACALVSGSTTLSWIPVL